MTSNFVPPFFVIVENRNSVCARDTFVLFSRWTPLHWSARNGHIGACRLLLQSNADMQAMSIR
jgi:hypothetical protein